MNKIIIKKITDLVFIEDKPQKADLIIVAGSKSKQVPFTVADLYKNKFANKIIFTGGFNESLNAHESISMRDVVIKSGVKIEDTFLEKKSTNTKENAAETLKIIKKNKLKHEKIIIVGIPYHALRLKMTFSKVFPDSTIFIAVSKNEKITKENWMKTDFGIWRVMAELERIGKYFNQGDLSL